METFSATEKSENDIPSGQSRAEKKNAKEKDLLIPRRPSIVTSE